jgi:hypothetical protein
LAKEKQLGESVFLAKCLSQINAPFIDVLVYLPFPELGDDLLFHLIIYLYEKASILITTIAKANPLYMEPIVRL